MAETNDARQAVERWLEAFDGALSTGDADAVEATHQSRHYSQVLPLQLKARYAGLETPVYGLQESHYRR